MKSPWITIEPDCQLPEAGEYVLIETSHGSFKVSRFSDRDITNGRHLPRRWFFRSDSQQYSTVRRWMRIPE
jgi:hypothetical protein